MPPAYPFIFYCACLLLSSHRHFLSSLSCDAATPTVKGNNSHDNDAHGALHLSLTGRRTVVLIFAICRSLGCRWRPSGQWALTGKGPAKAVLSVVALIWAIHLIFACAAKTSVIR